MILSHNVSVTDGTFTETRGNIETLNIAAIPLAAVRDNLPLLFFSRRLGLCYKRFEHCQQELSKAIPESSPWGIAGLPSACHAAIWVQVSQYCGLCKVVSNFAAIHGVLFHSINHVYIQ